MKWISEIRNIRKRRTQPMALSDAIHEIATQMESDCREKGGTIYELTDNVAIISTVIGFVRQLRSAVKAAEGQQQAIVFNPFEKKAEEVAAKRAIRELEDRINIQERVGSCMVNCVGGKSDDTMFEVDSRMPTGAKTIVVDEVYVRQGDGNLLYSEEETEKLRSKIKQS